MPILLSDPLPEITPAKVALVLSLPEIKVPLSITLEPATPLSEPIVCVDPPRFKAAPAAVRLMFVAAGRLPVVVNVPPLIVVGPW